MQARLLFHRFAPGNVSRQRDYRNATPRQRRLDRDLEDARHLLRVRNQFTVMTALREKMFRIGLLKISAPDFMTRDLRRNSQNRHTAAVTIIESIDQMEIAGSRTPGTDGQATSQMRF